MQEDLYATPEMVKQFRRTRRKSNGEMPDFMETLKLMAEEHALSSEPLQQPEINGHLSRKDFMRAYDRIPFNAANLFRNEEIRKKEKTSHAIFPPGRDVVSVQHIHDFGYREQLFFNFFSVTYIYEGRCNFKFGEDLLELHEGDLCILPPEFPHSIHAFPDSFAFEALIREDSFHIVFNDFLATQSRLSDFFSTVIQGQTRNYCVIHSDPGDKDLLFYLQSFVYENTLREVYSNACAVSLLKLFLGQAYRKYEGTMELYRNDLHQRRMDAESIYLYIRNHFMDVTLDQTAEHFHYNKTYLSRVIHKHFGVSFSELVTEMKIDHAREYLRNTGKHISDIAILVGYESADHFSRMFRKAEGLSPAAYRKLMHSIREDPGKADR